MEGTPHLIPMRHDAAFTQARGRCPAGRPDRIGAAIAVAVILGVGCSKPDPVARRTHAPSTVVVETAEQRDVPLIMDMVARTEASVTVEIRANVEGRLAEASFAEGR